MKFYRSNFIYLAIICFIFFFLAISYERSDSTLKRVEQDVITSANAGVYKDDIAVNFQLLNGKGEVVSLESFRGKKVILNFFATWCGPCQEEMPTLLQLNEKLKDKGYVILGINVTKEERNSNDVGKFIEHFKVPFDVLYDVEGMVTKEYQLIGIPTTFFIDENGKIVERLNGILTMEMISSNDFFEGNIK